MGRQTNLQVLALVTGLIAAMLLPPAGRATGGRYAFAGGTPRERAEVVHALDASSFDWQTVPARITIHIEAGASSSATPGEIWLDANLLNAGMFAWGVVQHEYAHQVDFFMLTAPARALLLRRLGGTVWCSQTAVHREQLGCERFASALAWAYWPSPENCMRPVKALAASGAQFRKLVSTLIRGGR